MNNIFSRIKALSFMMLALAFASCNDFLDKNPDDRTEIDTPEKVTKLLGSAYPDKTINFLTEFSSDNVMDNGKTFQYAKDQEEVYRFEQVTQTGNDSPKSVWSEHYNIVVTTNEALAAIEKIGLTEETKPLKAEALLCRAYAIFSLTNCFCMAYNDTTANKYLGIPYPKKVGEIVGKRGTLAETYANINADIEEALPLLDDSYLKVPAYHFNERAAYAFAARFNLYYQKWEKAKEYAEIALGSNPLNIMHTSLATYPAMDLKTAKNAYIDSSDPYNFLLVSKFSAMGRARSFTTYNRFGHNVELCEKETLWSDLLWNGTNGNSTLYEASLTYGSDQSIYTPAVVEFFETTDKINQTGFAHIIDVPFTSDETCLVHAEACIALNELDLALNDMNNFAKIHCSASSGNAVRPVYTLKNLVAFWKSISPYKLNAEGDVINRSNKKIFHAPFKIVDENQEAMVYTVLQMRRIETLWKGMRFQDIKRYGIEFSHNLDGEKPLVFKTGDLRGAIQLPQEVIVAKTGGLEPNPR